MEHIQQQPIAVWSTARDVWETPQTEGLFCEHLDVFSETFPTSGMTRNGMAYELPTWAPRMDGSGYSSLPVLPTPTCRDHKDHMIRREPHRPDAVDTLSRALVDFGDYGPAVEQWERVLGRRSPSPTITGKSGKPRLNPAFAEWMMGLPAGWVTDVPGVTGNEALKACGNGVVPKQAAYAISHLLERSEAYRSV